jgi:hypothetical protein
MPRRDSVVVERRHVFAHRSGACLIVLAVKRSSGDDWKVNCSFRAPSWARMDAAFCLAEGRKFGQSLAGGCESVPEGWELLDSWQGSPLAASR